jgi:uncharacterized DUF497 family protein
MPFEWDSQKSIANEEKHGIDFETAKRLWSDENKVEGQRGSGLAI